MSVQKNQMSNVKTILEGNMLNLSHKKLDVWKLGIKLVKLIYDLTKSFPKEELYGITNQMRRAAVSVPNNIAEGSARYSNKEKVRFYEVARSSVVEVDNLLEVSIELRYVNQNEISEINEVINEDFAILSNLIKSKN